MVAVVHMRGKGASVDSEEVLDKMVISITSLWSLPVALLINLLHLLQQLAHVEGLGRPRWGLHELIHQLEGKKQKKDNQTSA